MATLPGVYVEEVPAGVRTVVAASTSAALFIGWAARGPVGRAVRVSSLGDFERAFGGPDPRAWLGYAVRHFFENGGGDAYALRIAGADAASARASLGGLDVEAASPGVWANGLRLRTTRTGRTFRLDVLGATPERFERLSLSRRSRRFAPAILNAESLCLANVRLASTGATAASEEVALSGGADGVALVPGDPSFIARLEALFAPGAAVDDIGGFNLLCVPGLSDAGAIRRLQEQAYERRAFLIADSAATATIADVGGSPAPGGRPENAALYFPWVVASDPAQPGTARAFPPSGFVAGLYARTDTQRGVWKAPSGVEATITGATRLAVRLTDRENGVLNPQAVNCLRAFPGRPPVVWGARTRAGADALGSEWKYVPVRRLALHIERSLQAGLAWTAFEPNGEPLWAAARLNVGAFLHSLFRQGAFQGRSPREAYAVQCDRTTMTGDEIARGALNVRVGFAPLKPAEFVFLAIRCQAAGSPA